MYQMTIHSETSIKDIQQEFNSRYPSLWINFFYRSGSGKNLLSKANSVHPDKKIKEINNSSFFEPVNINGERTVSDVKTDFKTRFGLETQVLRKSGKLWIGTFLTENWSLAHQNAEGALFDS